jgi:CRP/FNR family transcriptional regulator
MAQVMPPLPDNTTLFEMGEAAEEVFVVRSGILMGDSGHENASRRVTGFYLPGEFLDVESLCSLRHACRATSLKTSSVIALPTQGMLALERESEEFQAVIHRVIGSAMQKIDHLLFSLSRKSAGSRIASFYLELSERFQRVGNVRDHFFFPAFHSDIASALRMTGATFSREIGALNRRGLLDINGGDVRLLDMGGLRDLAGEEDIPDTLPAENRPSTR